MSMRCEGSGSWSASRGARKRWTSPAAMPRAVSMRATISGRPALAASIWTAAASAGRRCQLLPAIERATRTPSAAPASAPAIAGSGGAPDLAGEVVLGVDHAHRAGLRAHHDRVRVGAAGEAAHAAQHRAVGDAGRGEHHVALGELVHRVLALEIGDPELG